MGEKIPPDPPNAYAIMNNNHAYHLAKPNEVKNINGVDRRGCKIRCPQCGCYDYKVYVDNAGQMIDLACGKCDRINSCDYHLPPREYFAKNPDQRRELQQLPEPEPREAYRIPRSEVAMAMRREETNLVKWLKGLPWKPAQRQGLDMILHNYCVGAWDNGWTTWWQVDENGVVHGGKIMAYKDDGHRLKCDENGNKVYSIDWIHSIYERRGLLDPKKGELVQCLFGQHLLKLYNVKKVNIVESEKSAVIAAAYFGDFGEDVWMACGGLMNFNRSLLLPLIAKGVEIDVYPDHDGFGRWLEKAKTIDYPKLNVIRYVEKRYIPGVDPDNADIADIILRKMEEERPINVMQKENPSLTNLINKFELTENEKRQT